MEEKHWLTVEEIDDLKWPSLDSLNAHNSVMQASNDFYYFWDETWSYAYGPFETVEEARAACAEYEKTL